MKRLHEESIKSHYDRWTNDDDDNNNDDNNNNNNNNNNNKDLNILKWILAPYPYAHGALQLNIQDRKFCRWKNYINNKTNI